jgi:thiol-disulfide isomerase/thioredoxin
MFLTVNTTQVLEDMDNIKVVAITGFMNVQSAHVNIADVSKMKKYFLVVFFILGLYTANAQVRTLTSEMFFARIWDKSNARFINESGIIIDFYATWCRPCYVMKPIFESVSNEFYNYYFYRVDIEQEEDLSEMFGIEAIPAIIYIPPKSANGKYFQSTGVITRRELINNIKKYLK